MTRKEEEVPQAKKTILPQIVCLRRSFRVFKKMQKATKTPSTFPAASKEEEEEETRVCVRVARINI